MAKRQNTKKKAVINNHKGCLKSWAESQISEAISLLLDYHNTDEDERDEEEMISQLNAIEDVLDECSDDGWSGYWKAVESISVLANYLGVEWASPYSFAIVDDDGNEEEGFGHITVGEKDFEVIRKVAELQGTAMHMLIRKFANSLKKEYAKELAAEEEKRKRMHGIRLLRKTRGCNGG